MKLAAFSLTYWNTEADANRLADELRNWEQEVLRASYAEYRFLAAGTHCNPAYNPTGLRLIQADLPYTHPHDYKYWCYAAAAETAGMWYALLNTDADVIMQICTDCIINCDLRAVAEELMSRPELIAAPVWCTLVEDAFCLYKREALQKFLHQRLRANLIPPGQGDPPITEQEKTDIFRGQWWNPWPERTILRQDWKVGSCHVDGATIIQQNWPVIIRPAPDVTAHILRTRQ